MNRKAQVKKTLHKIKTSNLPASNDEAYHVVPNPVPKEAISAAVEATSHQIFLLVLISPA